VRSIIAAALLISTGCGPGLIFNSSDMSPDDMMARATHVFIGVIQTQQYESWPFLHLSPPGQDPATAKCWKVLRRKVRVEMVLRGEETRELIDIYEFSGTCGAVGDWNSTRNGERALFLVRVENGRYHVVRDWWRSIFPVTSGPHSRLALESNQRQMRLRRIV